MTIKAKIITLYVVLSLVLLLIFSAFILSRTKFLVYEAIDINLRNIANNIENIFLKNNKLPGDNDLNIITNRYIIKVYNLDKKVIFKSELAKRLPTFPDFFPKYGNTRYKSYELKVDYQNFLDLDPDKYNDVKFRLFSKKVNSGYLLVAYPMEDTDEALANLYEIVVWGICILLVLITLFGFYFSHNALKPINDIIDKARYISDKSLDTRLNITSNDELGKLASTLNELFARLEKAFKKQQDFTANVSHELKTPLAMIKFSLENILNDTTITDETRTEVNNTISHISKLQNLISKLLLLSQIDYMHKNPEIINKFTNVNLSEMLKTVSDDFKIYFSSKNINFSLLIYNGDLCIKGDKDLLEKLFFNLFLNAHNFTPENGEITATLSKKDKRVIFSIKNTGQGIPEGKLAYIFDRFYRVDHSRSKETGGTGLGLSICKAITELHNGKIWAESVYNSFVQFNVEFEAV